MAESENSPDRDVPLRGVEKKSDRACHHNYCRDDACRLDVAERTVEYIKARLDRLAAK